MHVVVYLIFYQEKEFSPFVSIKTYRFTGTTNSIRIQLISSKLVTSTLNELKLYGICNFVRTDRLTPFYSVKFQECTSASGSHAHAPIVSSSGDYMDKRSIFALSRGQIQTNIITKKNSNFHQITKTNSLEKKRTGNKSSDSSPG